MSIPLRVGAVAAAIFLFTAAAAAAPQKRCGWFANPTPANTLLIDRDGEWWISSMGGAMGPDAEGADNLPNMAARGWVHRNVGSYGYGCACMTVDTTWSKSEKVGRITRIYGATPRPLRACRADRRLPRP